MFMYGTVVYNLIGFQIHLNWSELFCGFGAVDNCDRTQKLNSDDHLLLSCDRPKKPGLHSLVFISFYFVKNDFGFP